MKRPIMLISASLTCLVLSWTFSASGKTTLNKLFSALQPAASAATKSPRQTGGARRPQPRENFDIRAGHQVALNDPQDADITYDPAREELRLANRRSQQPFGLKRSRPSVQLKWSSLTGSPSRVFSFTENLTGPSGGDPEAIARQFLKNNNDLFRLGADGVDGLNVSRRYRTEHNGVTHVTLQQRINDIEVFLADMSIHVARDGSVLAASGELIPNVARTANLNGPKLTAAEGLRVAAEDAEAEIRGPIMLRTQPSGKELRQSFDRSVGFDRDVESQLVYFPISSDTSRLAWQFTIWMPSTPDVYLTLVDAENGAILFRHNLTCYDENPLKPHGQVYTKDSPRPNTPFVNSNPPVVPREDTPFHPEMFNGSVIFPVNDPHYDWWAGQPGNSLISNNTDTHLDRDSMANQPDLPRLMAADGNFSFPLDLTMEPTIEDNQKAAQVNLFYWINRYHDILYSFGFNEAAGNFQTNNFTFGGVGADAVLADAQDGSGTNNANFSTPRDGLPGRVQMFLWSGTPNRDGDLDQQVIIHELTHGTSNRLVGPLGLRGAQGGGMGEGWSDWFGLVLLRNENDALDGTYPVGYFANNNYTRGIRRFPYSTQMGVYPYTFKDIARSAEVHNVGEIWCNALWEVRVALIQKYGFKEGQRQSLQLVIDGMKLTPFAPSFVDARNAILLADRVNNNSANQCLLWQAFSKRGLGFRADTTDFSDGAPIESLDSAPFCADAGTVAIGRAEYLPGETMNLTLGDRNATGAITARVTSSKTGDSEMVTMTPEPNVQGSYIAALKLTRGRARANDGALQGSVEAGDQIVVTYTDANDGSGASKDVQVNAKFAREGSRFEDNIEEGNRGWIPEASWAITNQRSASGARSWTDSPAGRTSTNSSLISPLFDLTGLSEITLSFGQSYEFNATNPDYGIVDVSTDDGVSWRRVAAVTGASAQFGQARVRLRGLDGQPQARVRFRVQATSTAGDGWYIDDIRLLGRSTDPAIIPPSKPLSPAIASVAPAFGAPAGGARVTINGANFTETADTTVTFDGIPATNVSVISGTAILATAPPHAAGAVNVVVNNIYGAASLAYGYRYYSTGSATGAPDLKRLFPDTGVINGGTAVTLIGANFTPETVVRFGDRMANATYINSNTLRVIAPAGASTGAVDVTGSHSTSTSRLDKAFNYIAPTPPVVSVLQPTGGESLFARSVINIRWDSSDNRALANHSVSLQRFLNGTYQTPIDLATNLHSGARSFGWTIPILAAGQYRIRVIATDDDGIETEAYSGNFSLGRRWEPATVLPVVAAAFGATSDGRYIYQISGLLLSGNQPTQTTVRRLDTTAATPAWAEVAPIPTGLNRIEATYLKGKIYVPGGFNSSNQRVATHFAYDVATDTWASVADAPTALTFYSVVADDARGVYYRIGGSTATSSLAEVHSFNPVENKWTALPPMKVARTNPAADLINGKLYVAGGTNGATILGSAEVYDFGTGQWTDLAPMIRERNSPTSFVSKDPSGNTLWVVAGGADTATNFPNTEAYDLGANRWTLLDNSFTLNTPRQLLGGARAGNFFYTYGSNTDTTTRANERARVDVVEPLPLDVVAPVVAAPSSLVAALNNELRFTVTVNDLASGVPVMLTASGLPNGANFETRTATNNSVTGVFRWTPAEADEGKSISVKFTASDGQLSDTKIVTIQVVKASPLAAVNSADFRQGAIAIDSIASIFGVKLAVRTEFAQSSPLPLDLAGTTVTINGVPAQLFFVSETQINFAVPATLEPGPATIIVSNQAGQFSVGSVQIAPVAPAIFTANSAGTGDAAALATVDGVNYQLPPFDVLVNGRPNIIVFFATGVRRAPAANPDDGDGVAESVTVTIDGKPARTLFAGPQGGFNSLDQMNIELPASLAGGGERTVEVRVSVNGLPANPVNIRIR
ncbi:MAG TPA: M36 family metallopeptidase [Blastocatellia bacterium]|nr:M36 family metallopeptidase [Blastocatellia bacterium]